MTEVAWWQGAGLPVSAGAVLDHLVSHPEVTAGEIGTHVGLPTAEVDLALRALEQELLTVRVGGSPECWSASPPRAAMQAFLARRRAELASMELEAERLQETYAGRLERRIGGDQFEVLDTAPRIAARYDHLVRSAEREILYLVMPPYLAASEQNPDRSATQADAAARGVRVRSIYEAESFGGTLTADIARLGSRDGEEVRLSDAVPMKLVIIDDTAAIMTLDAAAPEAGSLLVQSPPVLRVLRALFDGLWEHALPWSGSATAEGPAIAEAEVDPRWVQVLQLMALGMKDDAIARALGVSRRTVQQVVSDVARRLGARTRFQIALQAQALGWLEGAVPTPAGGRPPAAESAALLDWPG